MRTNFKKTSSYIFVASVIIITIIPSVLFLHKKYIQKESVMFSESFGLRETFTRIRSFVFIRFFKMSPIDDVVLGKHKWLFYDSLTDGTSLQDFYGHALYSQEELVVIKNNLISIHDHLDQQKIHFLVVMAANKHTIYPEYLPYHVQKNKGTRTRADQVFELLQSTDINYFDTRNILHDSKNSSDEYLYYPVDTHWNLFGGFIVSREIIKKINSLFSQRYSITLKQISDNNFSRCDLARMIHFVGFRKSFCERKIITESEHFIINGNDINNDSLDPLVITSQKKVRGPKVVMFRDSFSIALIPYLSQFFSEVVYVWDFKIDFKLIKQKDPDIVILQFTERGFDRLLDIH